jgi:hypothetical protein
MGKPCSLSPVNGKKMYQYQTAELQQLSECAVETRN